MIQYKTASGPIKHHQPHTKVQSTPTPPPYRPTWRLNSMEWGLRERLVKEVKSLRFSVWRPGQIHVYNVWKVSSSPFEGSSHVAVFVGYLNGSYVAPDVVVDLRSTGMGCNSFAQDRLSHPIGVLQSTIKVSMHYVKSAT